jgi:hypothetical protein
MTMSVFDKQDPEQLTVEEIDQVIERYPYFAVLHFIKTAKLMAEEHAEAGSSAAKTALYFSNPQWLHYQLHRQSQIEDTDESMAELMTTYTDTEIFVELEEQTVMPEAEIEQGELEEKYDDKRVHQAEPEESNIDEIVPAVKLPQPEASIIDEVVPAVEQWEDENLPDEIVPAVELPEPEESIIDEIVPAVEQWEDETLPDEIVPAVELPEPEESIINEIVPAVELPEPEESIIYEIAPAVEHVAEDASTKHIPEEEDIDEEDQPVPGQELPALAMKTVDFTQDGSSDALIPIEPLYTIDYFASQGIKLPVEEIPNDQLGKKLKSFTEWLKSMKKLQPDKVDRQMDKDTELHIRTAAEHSNDSQELYTEALAEVYLKQGLEDKAIEVFKKLSLLDPSKSAYFAARIRELKEI